MGKTIYQRIDWSDIPAFAIASVVMFPICVFIISLAAACFGLVWWIGFCIMLYVLTFIGIGDELLKYCEPLFDVVGLGVRWLSS